MLMRHRSFKNATELLRLFRSILIHFFRDLKGIFLYFRNHWIINVQRKREFIFWGHLGLGDQICYATLYEYWADSSHTIHIPCKESYFTTLKQIYSYIPNLVFHPISNSSLKERREVEKIRKSKNLPLIVSGHETMQVMRMLFPKDGGQKSLIRTAGLRVKTLYSYRFRKHVLVLPQVNPPPHPYAFVNCRTSQGSIMLPVKAPWNKHLPIVEECAETPVYSYAELLDNAHEIRSVGSVFMCLAIVMGAKAPSKYFISKRDLKNDVPINGWKIVSP